MYRGKYEAEKPVKKVTAPTEAPEKEELVFKAPQRRPPKARRRMTTGTIVFYSIWLAVIAAFAIGLTIGLGALKDWLVDFEASQPDSQSQKVFEEYFQDPDWAQLYELAGIEDTVFEDVEDYTAYMEKTVAEHEITMLETSAGLTGGKKYVIRATLADGSYFNFATFFMTDQAGEDAVIPDWQLDQVELFTLNEGGKTGFQRDRSYRFLVLPGTTVTVNGVELGEEYIQRTVQTEAEEHLPEGLHGYRVVELEVEGLLTEPQIQALDEAGNVVELTYDADTGLYAQNIQTPEISQDEYDRVLAIGQNYCKYMIGNIGAGTLSQYIDSSSDIYYTITHMATWLQGYLGFEFGEETIQEFYRYSDTLYSARLVMDLNVTRTDGTIKTFPLNTTFFVEKQGDTWKVIDMTNVSVQEQVVQIRVKFMDGDQVLQTMLVSSEENQLTPPQVQTPEGKTFLGWYLQEGKLEQAEDGTITVPEDHMTEPLTIYALFEEA